MNPEYNRQQEKHDAPQFYQPQPHPYLHEPLLYISNLPSHVTDENLAPAFVSCGPFRPKIPRDGVSPTLSGTIEFKFIDKAEKALATLQARPIPGLVPPVPLVLSPYPPTNPPTPLPPPSAFPRLVKHLPLGYTDSQLYDLFRPFGALASVHAQTQFGHDTGMIEFWNEEDARTAEEAMHCSDVDGSNIAVQIYQPRRVSGHSEFSPTAPPFIPGAVYPYSQYTSPHGSPYGKRTIPLSPFIHGPGQQVQLAPVTGPGSNSHSGLIDPCNLFCKNLDPEIDSNGLFTHFRQFGQIVSARVMRNENGESRGFGFVSFQTPEQAAAAMHAMNGVQLGSKQIVVRLHEPKQLRQEKLAQRFAGHNGHPRSASGATSPTASEAGESHVGWSSPRHNAYNISSPNHYTKNDRGRRGSGSYYTAALAGTLDIPMRYDDLASLSPVVRKEVLTGEFSRRIKNMDLVTADELDRVVQRLVTLSLSDVVQCMEDNKRLTDHVNSIKKSVKPSKPPTPQKTPSPSASQDSVTLLDVNAAASAPEHPSTPISLGSTPPRTSSPSGSVQPLTERDRMLTAISKLESTRQTELTDLLMSLPKRERAMCLFNIEVLRIKLVDAKAVLDSEEEEQRQQQRQQQQQQPIPSAPAPVAAPVITQKEKLTPPAPESKPATSPVEVSASSAASSTHTVASLAKLPATDIVKLATTTSITGLPLPKADPQIVRATDEFIDGILDKPSQTQKQLLGEKLFKVVKSFGIKGAPKITVALLDQEDLRSLAHLMNSYPAVLKEKAMNVLAPK
ncbi:hypothetical protein AX16_004384 [Volvariella volvacea WC 439]|nr:hypothetical protein AX16_004384 [Volvariella volvacea WC 439]